MARTAGIGHQDFKELISKNLFYVDKTAFIKEWWESGDMVTLITRPRRFGKTLTMSMLEYFFSVNYAGQGDLFQDFAIWQDEKYREIQGTYPVINLSFANVKQNNYKDAKDMIFLLLTSLYSQYAFLRDSEKLNEKDRAYFDRVGSDMSDSDAVMALNQLSEYLYRYYGKKVIILLDEYDTPMQEAYVGGYWEELVAFMRSMFQAGFKTNPYLERAIMTGITRVSKESVFSDLNNLKVVTTTSNEYAEMFGFTEEEVFSALDELGLSEHRQDVKRWYDGFTFGGQTDIYNPWSILNYLDTGKLAAYWVNTSSNSMISTLIQAGNKNTKQEFETLLCGQPIRVAIDEQIVYDQLSVVKGALWSFLLASGYLKVVHMEFAEETGEVYYELVLTNKEVRIMFQNMIRNWFQEEEDNYNDFIQALLLGDLDAMNEYMNRVVCSVFSYFDTAKEESRSEPEKFYHGFVLGMIVELRGSYVVQSNRESGFGRYDIILEALDGSDAIIIEFKVFNKRREKTLEDTVQTALKQIEDKKYEQQLLERGFAKEKIHKYGFAFCGKKVLIGR